MDIQLAREASLTPSLVLKCSLNEKAEGAFTHAFCNAHQLQSEDMSKLLLYANKQVNNAKEKGKEALAQKN